jgi:tetratricopeptide (TPR) repeat protein
MNRCIILSLAAIVAGCLAVEESFAQRGGRGGGGGGGGGFRGGGGGGGFRAGAPAGGFSGAGRPAGGFVGGARPSGSPIAGGAGINRGPSFSSPGGGLSSGRPSGGAVAAGRPSLQPGTRPPIGSGPGSGLSGPGSGVATRPAVGAGGTRPTTGAGQRPAIGSGTGIGQRPATLPGLGNRGGLEGRTENRPQTRENRVASLQDRMAGEGDRMSMGERQQQRQDAVGDRQQQRQDALGQRQQNRQDYRGQAREDWQNWAGEHGDWYHGTWAGGWYPGAGWGQMWSNYPVAAALGVTWWGASRLSYAFGMGGYSNPYYDGGESYDYSQPVAAYQPAVESQVAAPATVAPTGTAPNPGVSQDGTSVFDQSRAAFARGDYAPALELCDQTLKTMPHDAVVHEFRSLALFALQKYRDAAAGAYAVLSAGPGWDWTTLSSLYGNVADYTTHLRRLESYVGENPNSSDAHFLLAYHYLTAGHADAARGQLVEVDKLTPNDRLVKQLLGLSSAAGQPASTPTPKPPLLGDQLLKAEQLVGRWTASGGGGSTFQMTLNGDSSYSWKFTSGKKSDEIKGVYAVRENNLAMEVNDGSTLLAEISLAGDQLRFKVIGGETADPGLTFTRSK